MKTQSQSTRELQGAITSILSMKSPDLTITICCQSEMDEFFKLQREGVCRYYLKNQCRKGDLCQFKHEEDYSKSAKHKTKLCKNFQERGMCRYKDQCSYAHGDKELRGGKILRLV